MLAFLFHYLYSFDWTVIQTYTFALKRFAYKCVNCPSILPFEITIAYVTLVMRTLSRKFLALRSAVCLYRKDCNSVPESQSWTPDLITVRIFFKHRQPRFQTHLRQAKVPCTHFSWIVQHGTRRTNLAKTFLL